MKKYAVLVDVSPSEQLSMDDEEIKVMGLVFGLRSPTSFDEVGNKFPDPAHRLKLKKWASSGKKYRKYFVEHARFLTTTNNVIFGSNVVSSQVIRDTGKQYWELLMGPIPEATSRSSKGRPMVAMGGYKVDGKVIPKYDVLIDDLYVLGWYAEALAGCLKGLVDINGEDVKLDALIDRLPNEQGGDDFYKATLLRQLCKKGTGGLLNIAGVPEKPDSMQRELLVDNLSGMLRHIVENEDSPYKNALEFFRFNRKTL